MAMDAGGEIGMIDSSKIDALLVKINDITQANQEAETQLFNERMSNLNAVYDLQVELAGRAKKKEQEIEKDALIAYSKMRQDAYDKAIKAEEKKRGHELSAEEKKAIAKKFKYEGKVKETFEKQARKKKEQADKKAAKEAGAQYLKEQQESLLGKGKSISERFGALKEMTTSIDPVTGKTKFDAKKAFATMSKTLSSLTQQLDKKVDEIASNKAAIDTRLQGSGNDTNFAGSYWDSMSKQIVGIAGASPLFKQEEIVNNLKTLVGRGISYNVTQRAFLQTIKDKIATTFDATNGTLLRLVRIQQQDTTAGRLGMESALNTFLNQMYETTEYMSDIMTSVKGSLEESMALMGGADAVAFEYQVQKWMGSLYSVGMSQNAVTGIASAIGKLASGDIEGLMGSGAGNLMVMSANQAGLSIADLMAQGLDESSTNRLMQSMVNYLADIYDQSADSLVVQQQMANVYGVTASDLKAATNLASSASTMNSIIGSAVNYTESIGQLMSMADSMYSRTSIGEMITNGWENVQYSMAAGMANNPVLYALNKTAGLLDDMVGGIALPFLNVGGFGVDLNTTVADLMRVGAMSGSILSSMGAMIGGGGGFSARASLANLGVSSSLQTVTRGEVAGNQRMVDLMKANGSGRVTRKGQQGVGTSESGQATMVGNANSGDIQDATLTQAGDDSGAKMTEAKESEDATTTSDIMDEHIVQIYELLQSTLDGTSSFSIKFDEGLFPIPRT